MAKSQNTLIIILAIVLAFFVAGGITMFFFLPDEIDTDVIPDFVNSLTGTAELDIPDEAFRLDVLQRSDYIRLNKQPVQNGSIPVAPPPNAGKANPFL